MSVWPRLSPSSRRPPAPELASLKSCDILCSKSSTTIIIFKQMLQEDALHIIQRAQNERIRMATGQYPRRTSGTFIVKRRKLSWFGHVCCHDTLPKIILQWTVDGSRRRGRSRKSSMDRPVIVVATHRRRWKTTGAHWVVCRWVPNDTCHWAHEAVN